MAYIKSAAQRLWSLAPRQKKAIRAVPLDLLTVTDDDIQRLHAIAEQWVGTYTKTGKPRHLATALTLYEQAARLRRARSPDATWPDID